MQPPDATGEAGGKTGRNKSRELGLPAVGPEGVFRRPLGQPTVELLFSHFSRRVIDPWLTVKSPQEGLEKKGESPDSFLVSGGPAQGAAPRPRPQCPLRS